jgi:signal transduction histidine kinase
MAPVPSRSVMPERWCERPVPTDSRPSGTAGCVSNMESERGNSSKSSARCERLFSRDGISRGLERTADRCCIKAFGSTVDAALRDSAAGFTQALIATRDADLFTLAQDLRNPLSAIHVASSVLARPDFGPEIRRNSTRRVRAALTQMDGLVSNLLEYTRRRSEPGIPVDQSSCDLKQVCEASIETVRTSHPARTFHLAVSDELVLCADAPRIQQALSNLLHNAIQHGDGQSVIKLDASADVAGASLSVWNAGRAIPEASLAAIFEPWVRVPGEASDRLPASLGLGLFIAREIVVAHGGTMAVTSDAVAGTRFTIWLPRHQANPTPVPRSSAADARQISRHAT